MGMFLSYSLAQGKILYIGDSQVVGYFGEYFSKRIRQSSNIILTYGSCGTTLKSWLLGSSNCGNVNIDEFGRKYIRSSKTTPKILQLIKEIRPDKFIFQFGGNYSNYADLNSVKKEIENFFKEINIMPYSLRKDCLWISHPDSRIKRELRAQLALALESIITPYCDYFNSTKVTQYPVKGGDGIHYSFKEAIPAVEKWSNTAFQYWLSSKPSH